MDNKVLKEGPCAPHIAAGTVRTHRAGLRGPHARPTWDQYMIPSLTALADVEVQRGRDVVAAAADQLRL